MNRSALNRKYAAALVLATFAGAGLLGAGCLGEAAQCQGCVNNKNDAGVIIGDSDGAVAAAPDLAVNLQAEFETKVQALLLTDCGGCHAQAGGSFPGFLAATATSSVYNTFTNFPGLIGYTPETSRILTKDFGGATGHPAPTYHMTSTYTPSAELQAHAVVIADFITLYNANGGRTVAVDSDMGTKTRIMPVLPTMGSVNTLELGQLDPMFTGMTVTFTPSLVGSTQIKLGDVKMKATATAGVHVKSPVFARYAAADLNVAVDIDYSMLGSDITAYMGSEVTFGTGILIFSYTAGEYLGLSFELIEQKAGSSDMGPAVGSCKNVAGFTAFKGQLTGGAGINCTNCHNAGVGGFSTGGFNMAANDATSCAGTLLNVVPATPNTSPIYLEVTDPGRAHAGGKLAAGAATTFLNQMTTWLNGEI